MLTVARNSIDLTAALVNDNSPPEVFTAAVRVGYDVEQFYGGVTVNPVSCTLQSKFSTGTATATAI
jgi:hypothetical protein